MTELRKLPHTLQDQLSQLQVIRHAEKILDRTRESLGVPGHRAPAHDMGEVNTMLAFDQQMDRK